MKGDVSVYRLFCQSGDSADSLQRVPRSFSFLSQVDMSEIRLWNKFNSEISRDTPAGGEEDINTEWVNLEQSANTDSMRGTEAKAVL